MLQKGIRQLNGVGDAPESPAEFMSGLFDLVSAEVGKFATLDVVPNSFRRIQIRCVSWQPLNCEPVPLFEQESFHDLAAMGRKVIPDQDDLGTFDETLQVFQERDEALGVEAIRLGSGEQARFSAVPPEPERRRYRRLGPMITAGPQDRCFPSRCPSPADRGLLAESSFVLKEDPGTLLDSVFFSAGQRTFFQ